MRVFDKIIIILGGIMSVVVAGVVFLYLTRTRASNCGGNSAALSACQMGIAEISLAADNITQFTNINQLSLEERASLGRDTQSHWIPGAKILVRTNIDLKAVPKRIILVCDTLYNNVPQPTFSNYYRKNPAYAVGYSDRSVGLISPIEFKKINLSEFIDPSLIPTNAESAKN